MNIQSKIQVVRLSAAVVIASLLAVACVTDPMNQFEVDTIELVSTASAPLKMIETYQEQISSLEDLDRASDKVLALLRATYPRAERSASKVHALRWIVDIPGRAESRRVRAVFDNVPDDDSVSGFYFELMLTQTDRGPKIENFQQSWRCWPGRGHQRFKAEPCS